MSTLVEKLSYRRMKPILFGILSFAIIFGVWETVVATGLMDAFFASKPTAIAVGLTEQVASGELYANFLVSLSEFVIGFGLAIVSGILLGVLAGWYRTVEYILDPFVWFLYSAPLIAFYPMFVVWVGLGKPTVILITYLLSVTPILVNTLAGIKNVSPDLVRAAVSFGATRSDLFLKVALPASVPMVMAGLKLGVGRALTGVIIAELFGANAGLGHSIAYYAGLLKTNEMMTSLVVVVCIGVVFTQALGYLESKFDSWRV
ncbi:MAG: ABC transporter permease [Rhodospirillaceae bacterium]|jgi:NitT/TauT family transport system permease protein